MSVPPIDLPVTMRPAEALPLEPLARYLRSHLPDAGSPIEVLQYPGGFSNLTYLVRAGDREVVLRRPPPGVTGRGAHDMLREFRLLSHLAPAFGKVPCPLLACEDTSVIGTPFYLMERVTGVILRAHPPAGVTLDADTMRRLSAACAETLAEIHAIDFASCGLGDFGRPDGYVQRQVEGWRGRYARARTDDIPDIERLGEWLETNRPGEAGAALVHNDYKYDNLVLDPQDLTHIVAVLDWEMAAIGDPLLDVGSSLAYWTDPDDPGWWRRLSMGVTTLPGNVDRAGFLEAYQRASGRDAPNPVFYYAYGLFKLAVIVQQIFARYRQGTTHDPRFAALLEIVGGCGRMASRAIELGRVGRLA